MKKTIALFLATVMMLGVFAGCGSKKEDSAPAAPETEQTTTPETPATKPEATEPEVPAAETTIKVAAVSTAFTDTYPEMWKEVADAFTAETGIAVELIEEKNLEDVISPAMQGGEYPDVIYLPYGRPAALTEQFVKGDLMADLTDVLSMTVPGEEALVSDKIAGGFTDNSMTNPYGDGKTYLAPMFYDPCGLFYNAGLFEEKGWEVPATWDEMWELGEKAKAEGIALFTYPTAGYFDAFLYALLNSVGGSEFFDAVTTYQEGIWETEEGNKVFEILNKLAQYTNPVTPAQANDQDFTQNQQLILDNKALFCPNGTWLPGEMADAPRAGGFKWGMTALPALEEGGAGYSFCWFQQAWIPAQAENIDAAKQFIAFLYSDKACEIFLKGGAVQPVIGVAENLEGEKKEFFSLYDNGAKAAMGGFAATESVAGLGTTREVYQDPMNALVSGNLTAEQWQADVIAANDQFRANMK